MQRLYPQADAHHRRTTTTPTLRSDITTILIVDDIETAMDPPIACLARRLDAYMAEGSGWMLDVNITVHMAAYQPLHGATYLPTPVQYIGVITPCSTDRRPQVILQPIASTSTRRARNDPPTPTRPQAHPVSRTARNLSNTCPGPVCASYHVSEKYDWTFRPTSATTVIMGDILGDSNVTRISTLPRAGRPVHAHSYRGAKLCHFANQILESPTPERSPQTVILSIGINSGDINKNMAADQVRRLFYRANTKFPMPEF